MLMSKNIGKLGEEAARKYIKKEGMKILEKNFRFSHGEIDIIARDNHQIVFVEVKSNSAGNPVPPELRVTQSKQYQIGKIARAYLQTTGKTDCNTRFDVIGVTFHDNGKHEISHTRNAFWLPGNI